MDTEVHIGGATAPNFPPARQDPTDPIQCVLQQIATGVELRHVLEGIARLWGQTSRHFPHCAVLLTSSNGDRLWVASAPGMPSAFRGLMWVLDADTRPSFFTGQGEALIEDTQGLPVGSADRDMLLAMGVGACWRLPVKDKDDRLLGALIASGPGPARPDREEQAFIGRLAHLVRISIEKSQVEHEVAQLSNFDGLTGLPNRSSLLERLGQIVAHGCSQGTRTGLLLLNLDGMSRINESLGYAFGDECLKAVAKRLREQLRPNETLSRFGGDEFALLVEAAPDAGALVRLAQRLLDCVTRSLKVGNQEIFVTASLGAAMITEAQESPESLFRHADAALRRAKTRGGNSLLFYAPEFDTSAGRLTLLSELRRALERGEFAVHYQPKQDLRNGSLAGAEALLRWRHPQRGLISPAEFIPLLEETGLILPVGEWLIRRVCSDLKAMAARGHVAPRIAINLSARQFHQPDLAGRIAAIVRETDVEGENLEFEVTESLMMQEPELTVRTLISLKRLGMQVAVDDFGVGYSSLGYLKRFPIDVLKIDKSFVAGVATPGADGAIVEAIIRMGHSLGMRVVAEGVEHPAQREFLAARGCDLLQGYLYSRPLDLEGFVSFLASHARSTSRTAATRAGRHKPAA